MKNLFLKTIREHNSLFLLIFATYCMLGESCKGKEELIDNKEVETPKKDDKVDEDAQSFVAHITHFDKLNLGTDKINSHEDDYSRSSLKMNYRLLQNYSLTDYPRYPRVKRMKNGSYILFYHNGSSSGNIGRRCFYATSPDLKSWNYKGEIFSSYDITDSNGNKNIHCYANCDATVLLNGDILAVASFRANSNYRSLPNDAGIEIKRSTDNGLTWSEPIAIYKGVTWEPYILELPSGTLQCYFTDSSRTGIEGHGTDTGTGMVVSTDGGKTWTPNTLSTPYYVFRIKWEKDGIIGFNHQMPTVIKLNNNKGLAAAAETNYLGKYYISFCYTDKDEWEHLAADQEGPADSNNKAFSGTGPYLDQFPSGETVLSYETSSKFSLMIGDSKARNFNNLYQPFSGGYWASLKVVDSHLLIGANVKTSIGPIQYAQFALNHRIDAISRTVKVDGNNNEWKNTDHALFIGEKSQAQSTLRCSYDKNNIYFLLETLDRTISVNDYATLYISKCTNNKISEGDCMIKVSTLGLQNSSKFEDGNWKEKDYSVMSKSFVCDSNVEEQSDKYGYINEISIPRSEINIIDERILVNFSIYDKTSNTEDALYNTSSDNTSHWIVVSGIK